MAQSSGRNLLFAVMAGMVGSALVPLMRPVMSRSARPGTKRAIRAGLAMYEQAAQTFGEGAETTSDLIAEVQAEPEAEQQSAAAPESNQSDQVVPLEMRQGAEPERKLHA